MGTRIRGNIFHHKLSQVLELKPGSKKQSPKSIIIFRKANMYENQLNVSKISGKWKQNIFLDTNKGKQKFCKNFKLLISTVSISFEKNIILQQCKPT